jgi:hypothetical protein
MSSVGPNIKLFVKVSIVLISIATLTLFGIFFYKTGGFRILTVAFNYLIPNIPNKKYTWIDFVDRGPNKKINGFYAGEDGEGFRMWTLSGLMRFSHNRSHSVYGFKDVCQGINSLKNRNSLGTHEVTVIEELTGDFDLWRKQMDNEYFVTVTYMDNPEKSKYVLRAWGVNVKYKIIGVIEKEGCSQ